MHDALYATGLFASLADWVGNALVRRTRRVRFSQLAPPVATMKLKSKEIPDERQKRIKLQNHCCALCGASFAETDIVHLDHCHDNGSLRGALHGPCNMLLGKLERGLKRGIRDPQGFMNGLAAYINSHRENPDELIHPTHFSPAEKKERAKKRAKRKLVTKAKSVTTQSKTKVRNPRT